PGRGFSFQRDEPLDMRMDRTSGETAADLVAQSTERDLADAIFKYGEERFSRRIARAIVDLRRAAPIDTTGRLAAVLRRVIPRAQREAARGRKSVIPRAFDDAQARARKNGKRWTPSNTPSRRTYGTIRLSVRWTKLASASCGSRSASRRFSCSRCCSRRGST